MNRFLREKFIAFTLAEMMVILALFSTIAAATLPVVTARRALDTSEMATGGSTIDPWTYSSTYDGLAYNNAKSALAGTSAVMVGGQVSADAYSIGYPQLIVRNIYGTSTVDYGNHIVFLKRNSNGNTYLGGSISMGKYGGHTIAIGANAMADAIGNTGSIAIGSYAIRKADPSRWTIGIGYGAGYGTATVGIGVNSCGRYSPSPVDTVCIGQAIEDLSARSVGIGGFVSGPLSSTTDSVAIGTYAIQHPDAGYGYQVALGYASGNGLRGSNTVTIGFTPSGAAQDTVLIGSRASSYARNVVTIGTHAKALYSTTSCPVTMYGAVAIGHYAGYNLKYRQAPTIIGVYAGAARTDSPQSISTNDTAYPVLIGYMAGAFETSGSPPYMPDVAIGAYSALLGYGNQQYLYGSTFMGNFSGYDSKVRNSVCIGHHTCSGETANQVVRIAPYGYYYVNSTRLSQYTSYIGNPVMIEALDATTKANFVGSSTNSNMLITPAVALDDLETSSIVFYANTVYGPSTTFTSFSDKRLKENIKPAKYGLNDIRKINIYEYNLKEKSIKKRQIGVIAQEMKEVIPEGVNQMPSGYYTVNADWLIFPVVNAIKELDKTFVSLKSDLTKYFNEYVTLVSRVNTLEKEVKTLERENKSLTREVNIAYRKAKTAERRQ